MRGRTEARPRLEGTPLLEETARLKRKAFAETARLARIEDRARRLERIEDRAWLKDLQTEREDRARLEENADRLIEAVKVHQEMLETLGRLIVRLKKAVR